MGSPAVLLAVASALVGSPARAGDAAPACEDAKKAEHFAAVREGADYAALHDFLPVRDDKTRVLVGQKAPLEAFTDAAPDTCAKRVEAWKFISSLLGGGTGGYDPGGAKLRRALKDRNGYVAPADHLYFIAGVEKARRALPRCDEKKRDKDPNCKGRDDKLLEKLRALTPPSEDWTQAKALKVKDRPEPCLQFAHGVGDTLELVPDVWIDALLPAEAWREVWKVPDDGMLMRKTCVSLAEASKAAAASIGDQQAIGKASAGQFGGAGITTDYEGTGAVSAKPAAPAASPPGIVDWNGNPVKFSKPEKKKASEPPPPGISTKFE